MNENDTQGAGRGTGRDAKGRFVKGNRGGPGNPFGRLVGAFRTALLTTITEEDIQRVGTMRRRRRGWKPD
jgi:hypothetical protein